MPTATLEEYLEAIYKLAQKGPVRPTQVAESMGVSGPTVTVTLRRLESHGLVSREGTTVLLTAEGEARALDIVRRHRVAERFLVDLLGLDWEAAHEDACLLEHALSDRVLEALERVLGDPDVCPHGHPIPKASGEVAVVSGRSLATAAPGSIVRVLRVDEDDEAVLGYLGGIGLRPGVSATVLDVAPFEGPLTLEVSGRSVAIAHAIAERVTVEE